MVQPNLLAVLVAGIIPMFIGALWYSPVAFGSQWMRLIGKTEEEIREASSGKSLQMYGSSFIASLIMAYVLAYIIQVFADAYGAEGIWAGMQSGFWVWLGFVATVSLQTVNFEFRRTGLYLLNICYNLVCLLAMGALLGVWR